MVDKGRIDRSFIFTYKSGEKSDPGTRRMLYVR